MLTVHDLEFDRVVPVAAALCAADMAELDAAGIEDVQAMLMEAVPLCQWAQEARWNGESVAIFGVRPIQNGKVGVPWMLTTVHMESAERAAVARAAARAVARMRAEFPTLINWVHAKNTRAIRFIEWLGFDVKEQRTGANAAFRQFTWRRA